MSKYYELQDSIGEYRPGFIVYEVESRAWMQYGDTGEYSQHSDGMLIGPPNLDNKRDPLVGWCVERRALSMYPHKFKCVSEEYVKNKLTKQQVRRLHPDDAAVELPHAPAAVAVVMPERKRIPKILIVNYHESVGWNACIDELARLNRNTVPMELLERAISYIERHTYFQFGEPLTSDDVVGRLISDELRSILAAED